ncbi:MAG: FecR domain-containing protein, partial [Nitrospirae bacterium]|nr:FecR domain-containing protein [Nitrospirota bacterium]
MSGRLKGRQRFRVCVVACVAWWGMFQMGLEPPASAQPAGGRVSATATLSVLGGTVQHVTSGGTQAQARDGMDLALGDRVLTGPKSTAVITFLDGTTVTVQPDSDVQVKKADITSQKSTISIKINLGVVWARVVRLADPKSSLSLESNTATATVHDGLIGGEMTPDHFMCWTMAGPVTVTDPQGQVLMVLLPGEKTMVQPNGKNQPAPAAFSVNQSTLRVTASAGVLPLVVMDDGARVAGFVAPTIEVNQ